MEQLVAVSQAEAFYDRVLVGYGDDSVAELGGAHVACEEISNVAAKLIEDARIGLSPLEKSTRYVNFSQKINGQYRYVREQRIMQSRWASVYEAAMDGLFDTYVQLLEPTITWVRARTPRDAQTSERAYNSATRAKAFDLLRGLLPMATRTNVGVFANGRAFEYLITRLGSHDLAELHQVSDHLQQALDQLIPSFVKRAKTPRGTAMRNYLAGIRQNLATAAKHPRQTRSNRCNTPGHIGRIRHRCHDTSGECCPIPAYHAPIGRRCGTCDSAPTRCPCGAHHHGLPGSGVCASTNQDGPLKKPTTRSTLLRT